MFFRKKKKIIETIKARYGIDPLQTPAGRRCRDRLEQVRIFYDTFRDTEGRTEYDIDDITWSDLEMDEVFLRINQTGSYIGEQVLYQTLHSGKDSFFTENRELMEELGQNEKVRQKLAFRLFSIGKVQQSYYLPEFFKGAELLRPDRPFVFRILQAVLACCILLAVLFRKPPFFMALAAIAGVNFIVHLLMKQKYDVLLSSLSGVGTLLGLYEWCIQQKEISLPVSDSMRENREKLKKIQKKIGFLVYMNQANVTGDIVGLMFDYLLGIALIDVARLDSLLHLISESEEEIFRAFSFVGKLDAAISILSFRKSLSVWSLPEFTDFGDLTFLHLYHPLLADPVSNDFSLRDRAILTGANASGKSTFMKALAVNVLLAQTIDTCCASGASLPVLKVMTSMAIRDDVVSGESYYVREVRYLKRMLDEIRGGALTLCVIDEILKGTNQKERLAASESVLKYLTNYPGYCIIATHDMELVEKLQDTYEPYYFESRIEDNNVTFDYRIHRGRGGESNALALLKAFGFPDEIIREAYDNIS